jgi:hypothetical protein
MIPALRKAFNESFTKEKYEAFLQDLYSKHPGAIEFRVAETPVFVDKAFANKMLDACESIIDFITAPNFKTLTERSIPDHERMPNENDRSHMIAFDFGVCINEEGNLEPQLIEMQGFPTLYGFQIYFPQVQSRHFLIPETFSHYLNGYNEQTYLRDLRDIIVDGESPENVILLEIKPHEQKTRIDFYCTRDYLNIEPVCITELIQQDQQLYYMLNGKKTLIKRIYNRVIFDDLNAQKEILGKHIDITQEFDVQWVPHSNWFYRISKFTLPFIHHPYVPETFFLNEIKQLPRDLENFVLKPLFSFAGQGVVIDIREEDINLVENPENWILQRKVKYADAILTPDIPAKAEIRMMYLWKDSWLRPKAAINLARLSKGKMIGIRYNKDKEWVGGSVAYFENSRK